MLTVANRLVGAKELKRVNMGGEGGKSDRPMHVIAPIRPPILSTVDERQYTVRDSAHRCSFPPFHLIHLFHGLIQSSHFLPRSRLLVKAQNGAGRSRDLSGLGAISVEFSWAKTGPGSPCSRDTRLFHSRT